MITIVGSINMDIVVQMDMFPKQGETILGQLFTPQVVDNTRSVIEQSKMVVMQLEIPVETIEYK